MSQIRALTTKRAGLNKFTMGFLAAAMAVVMGTAGAAQAAPAGKPTKEDCKKENYGKCVSDWAKKHGGGGYGGNTTINIDIDLTIIGNGNVITIRLFG